MEENAQLAETPKGKTKNVDAIADVITTAKPVTVASNTDGVSNLKPVILNSDFSFQVGNDVMCKPDSKVISTLPLSSDEQKSISSDLCPVKTQFYLSSRRRYDPKCNSLFSGDRKCHSKSSMLSETVEDRWTGSDGKEHYGLSAKVNFDRNSRSSGKGTSLDGMDIIT